MLNLNVLQGLVNNTVAKGADQTKVERAVPMLLPEGDYNVIMTEYIETGMHVPMFQGKPTGKPACMHVRIGFVVVDEKNPNGVHRLNLQEMPISMFDKSAYHRIFKLMQASDNTIKHLAQFLGRAFTAHITEYTSAAGKVSNVLDKFSIRPIMKFNGTTGAANVIPVLNSEQEERLLKLFIWSKPTKDCWDSLHIQKSNFIQERCLASLDIDESPLMSMLNPAPKRMEDIFNM